MLGSAHAAMAMDCTHDAAEAAHHSMTKSAGTVAWATHSRSSTHPRSAHTHSASMKHRTHHATDAAHHSVTKSFAPAWTATLTRSMAGAAHFFAANRGKILFHQRRRNRRRGGFVNHAQLDLIARLVHANQDGELMLINDQLIIHFGKHVKFLQTRLFRRAVGGDFVNRQPGSFRQLQLSANFLRNRPGADA
jgi:hypothetical protein